MTEFSPQSVKIIGTDIKFKIPVIPQNQFGQDYCPNNQIFCGWQPTDQNNNGSVNLVSQGHVDVISICNSIKPLAASEGYTAFNTDVCTNSLNLLSGPDGVSNSFYRPVANGVVDLGDINTQASVSAVFTGIESQANSVANVVTQVPNAGPDKEWHPEHTPNYFQNQSIAVWFCCLLPIFAVGNIIAFRSKLGITKKAPGVQTPLPPLSPRKNPGFRP